MSANNPVFRKRRDRVRIKLKKVSNRNRLSVFKSGRHIYAQIIDDSTSKTLVAASTLDKTIRKSAKQYSNRINTTFAGQKSAFLDSEVLIDISSDTNTKPNCLYTSASL